MLFSCHRTHDLGLHKVRSAGPRLAAEVEQVVRVEIEGFLGRRWGTLRHRSIHRGPGLVRPLAPRARP